MEFIVEAPREGQRLEDCRILVTLVGRPEHEATWLTISNLEIRRGHALHRWVVRRADVEQ